MNHQHAEFRNRLRQLDRKHAKAAHGFRARMRSDGLIVVEPQKVVRSGLSGKVFILFVVVGLMFKAFLMAALGYASYDYRVAQLGEGSMIERGGAFLMQRDPVSYRIAEELRPLLR